ncbi:MAG: GAF and ANTAR domain-containing protein [Actinobacteria bacterium]|nr:GAF and ANTAR domain-containing protein [Actinomycetota bacterium]
MAEEIGESLVALHQYFVGDATLEDTLHRVCEAAISVIPAATQAGISMTVNGRVGTYVFTDPETVEIDRPQYDTGDGPCITAFRTGETVFIDSTRSTERFPAFSATALAHGVLSVMSVPMNATDETVGALNLYAPTEHAFDGSTRSTVEHFASHAAYLLVNARAYWDARMLGENLGKALESRSVIEQAKGIIMGTTGCSADQAFQRLVEQSQHENIKLRELAAEIVQRSRTDRP